MSLIRVMTMTAGGVDFNTVFTEDGSVDQEQPLLTYFMWVVFLVLMPVLLANLLVSTVSFRQPLEFTTSYLYLLSIDWIGC